MHEPVDHRLDIQSLVSHRLDSIAPGMSGRRASTPEIFSGDRETTAWLEKSTLKMSLSISDATAACSL